MSGKIIWWKKTVNTYELQSQLFKYFVVNDQKAVKRNNNIMYVTQICISTDQNICFRNY